MRHTVMVAAITTCIQLSAIACSTAQTITVTLSNTGAAANGTADAFLVPMYNDNDNDPSISNAAGGVSDIFPASPIKSASANAASQATGVALSAVGAVVSQVSTTSAASALGGANATFEPSIGDATIQALYNSNANSNATSSGNANGQGFVAWGRAYAAVAGGANVPDVANFATAQAVAMVENQGATATLGTGPSTVLNTFIVTTNDNVNGLTATTNATATTQGFAAAATFGPHADTNAANSLASSGAWGYLLPAGVVPQDGDNDFDGDRDAGDIDILADEVFVALGGMPTLPLDPVSVFDENSDIPLFLDLNMDQEVSYFVSDSGVIESDSDFLIRVLEGTEYGDANLDGMVDLLDLDIVAANYNMPGGWADGDFNGDGVVDLLDLGIVGDFFGFGSSPTTSVPEPTALFLIGLAALAAMKQSLRS